MTRLHKFNRKTTCLRCTAFLFCIAITLQSQSRCPFTSENYFSFITDAISESEYVINKQWATGNGQYESNNKYSIFNIQSSIGNSADTLPPAKKKQLPSSIPQNPNSKLPTTSADTSSVNRTSQVTNAQADTTRIDTFSIRISKDTLDAPVHYEAEDSAVLLVKEQKFLLYGNTRTTYKDVVLTAPHVVLDQKTNVLTALGERDAAGNIITRAQFEQGKQRFQSDSLQYNFKTQKGLTANTFTQEGELFIKAGIAKKVNENTMFIKEGFYTTCNLDEPHFAFKSNKLKVVNDKVAVSGPTHPEFEGVPVPLYLPFGIYPLFQGRHSGFLPPQFTANEQLGLGLEGIGYYHVLNDFYDVAIRGNIYSYGGWTANITPTYRKRYRYNGSFNLAMQHTKIAFKGDPDYNLTKTFNISWSHAVDPKARPGTTFSANVNAGSTKFNQFVPNNPIRNVTNQLYSSIAYGKQWKGRGEQSPNYSLQLSANHNQNNRTGDIYLTLPDAGFAITTQYPFQRKEMTGTPKWYEKIGVGYNVVARNQVVFNDSNQLTLRRIADTLQWGARHSFPISLQLPPLGDNFFISPSISYEETWLTNRLGREWNGAKKKVDTIVRQKGLFIDRHMSVGLSLNTNIFGLFDFKNSAIRHVIRPSVGVSYSPNLSRRFYDVIQVDTLGNRMALPQFQNNLFSGYAYGRFGGMTFSIDNNLEMKKKNRRDSASQDKKIRLIDQFSISSAYNFLKDSQRLEPFSFSLTSTLFEKISLTAQGLLDPYDVGPTGQRIDRFVWQGDRFRLGNLQYGSIAMSTNFQSKPRDPSQSSVNPGRTITDPTLLADQQRLAEYMNRNPAEFVDFNIPWNINLSYSLSFQRTLKPDYSGYQTTFNSSVSFNNDFSLTPKWKFGTNGFFDFNTKQLTMFSMNIARDLHCWQMAMGVTPIGPVRYFNVTISPKSSILQDLKVNRTRYFYNY